MRLLLALAVLFSMSACSDKGRQVEVALTRPKFIEHHSVASWTSVSCIDTSAFGAHDQLDALVDDLFVQARLRRPLHTADAARCQWMLRVTDDAPTLIEAAQLVWDASGADPERFAATSTFTATGMALTTITATTERGAAFGVRGTLQFLVERFTDDSQRVVEGTLVDFPGFSRRGIIEGFYGPTFSADERATLIDLAAYLRQNTYVYALKDADPFTHSQWRDPYDAQWASTIRSAVEAARRNLIDFVWAASPGYFGGPAYQSGSIHYGGDADFARLVAKTENLRSLGVQRFALFVDDVAPDFAWPDDAARFSSLAAAHAYLMNRWDDYLMATGAPDHLWVVGTKYTSDSTNYLSGAGWEDYNGRLAAALHPGIQMFWTGPQVYSERIEASDLTPINDIIGRQVLVWDNWPKLPEALTGRAPNLDRRAGGLLSNFVMENDKLSASAALHDFEQALGTIADYAWQPDSYDPAWSLQRWTTSLDGLLHHIPAN